MLIVYLMILTFSLFHISFFIVNRVRAGSEQAVLVHGFKIETAFTD